jgi:hypothetical protein
MCVSRGAAPLAAKLLAAPAVFPSAARSVHARRSGAECRAKSLEASFTGEPTFEELAMTVPNGGS